MKVRCNNCMSVFDEKYIKDDGVDESCPVCVEVGSLMDMPENEFPQCYDYEPKSIK